MVREIDVILELVRKHSIALDLPLNMIHASQSAGLVEVRPTVMFRRQLSTQVDEIDLRRPAYVVVVALPIETLPMN